MRLAERLAELKGQLVKIGCENGAAFIFLGYVTDGTATIMRQLSKGSYINEVEKKYDNMLKVKENYPTYEKETKDFYNEATKHIKDPATKKVRSTREKLRKYKKLPEEEQDLVKLKTLERDLEKALKRRDKIQEERKEGFEKLKATLVQEYDRLLLDIDNIKEYLANWTTFADAKIVSDYRSIDPDLPDNTRILIIEGYKQGKVWLPNDIIKDPYLNTLLATYGGKYDEKSNIDDLSSGFALRM